MAQKKQQFLIVCVENLWDPWITNALGGKDVVPEKALGAWRCKSGMKTGRKTKGKETHGREVTN